MLRRTCAVVNLGKIAHNIRELKRAAGTDVMAVVKADAYGHGMEAVAKTAAKNGVHWMAVATPEEALAQSDKLREYQLLQYNNLFDGENRSEAFFYGKSAAGEP